MRSERETARNNYNNSWRTRHGCGEFLFPRPGGPFRERDPQLYAFVQVPLYQGVNGAQLTARTGFVVGTSYRF